MRVRRGWGSMREEMVVGYEVEEMVVGEEDGGESNMQV